MKRLSATQTAARVGVSVKTLTTWYSWYQDNIVTGLPEGCPKLPMFHQEGVGRPRQWDEDMIPPLIKFKQWVPRGRGGLMGSYNAKHWGKRGERAIKNKQLKETE